MKHKPKQEQTVGLTQVGTLHGELPELLSTYADQLDRIADGVEQTERLVTEMLAAFDRIAYSPTARIDAKVWAKHFRRRMKARGEK